MGPLVKNSSLRSAFDFPSAGGRSRFWAGQAGSETNTSKAANVKEQVAGLTTRLTTTESARTVLPLPARHERGEGHSAANRQVNREPDGPPLPIPLLPSREEREKQLAHLGFN